MDAELDDDELVAIRDEDKTRPFAVPVRGPVIDDLAESDETVASPLPSPAVAPFAATQSGERLVPRAEPPAPRLGRTDLPRIPPSPSAPVHPADAPRGDAAPTAVEAKLPMTRIPDPPTPPTIDPQRTHKPPLSEQPSVPTIVVKPIVHEPSASRVQREATVVVKRAVRKTKRSPVAGAIVLALVIVAAALAFVGIRRTLENRAREAEIEQRVEALRRQQGN